MQISICTNFFTQIMQIENEFGPLEYDQGEPAKAYAAWAAKMAIGLDTGVPWVMCKEDDAPDPVVCVEALFVTPDCYVYLLLEFPFGTCLGFNSTSSFGRIILHLCLVSLCQKQDHGFT